MTELLLGDHISVHAQLRASYEALRVVVKDETAPKQRYALDIPMMPCCKCEKAK